MGAIQASGENGLQSKLQGVNGCYPSFRGEWIAIQDPGGECSVIQAPGVATGANRLEKCAIRVFTSVFAQFIGFRFGTVPGDMQLKYIKNQGS